jgi:hypothetical protein
MNKNWAGGMAQVVECLLQEQGPEFKPEYDQKN